MPSPSERSAPPDTTVPLVAATRPEIPETATFLVVEPTSSRHVSLPREASLVLGRGEDAEIRVDDPSVSRRHARLERSAEAVRVVDLESRNGVRVNGSPIAGPRALSPGDVIAIGEVTLILRGHVPPRSRTGRAILSAGETSARLEQEIERAIEYARPVSVAVFTPDGEAPAAPLDGVVAAIDAELRAIDPTGLTRDGDLVVVLPELGADEARATMSLAIDHLEAHAPAWRAGVASCPADGCDAETLLAAARAASSKAGAHRVGGDGERVVSLTIGERAILFADPAMIRLFSLIERLAAAALPVLIVGETGAGKEHAALAVHQGSPRRAAPFVSVNCAAIPDTLVESELFGYEKGAFSGAQTAKPGLFERAEGGTLFLDEVGELSLAAQAKLLRVLEGGRFSRLGDGRERTADVRLVAATNRDLAAEVKARRFREDLLYRLNSAVVLIPPLRERPGDIPLLARHFLAAARARAGAPPLSIAPRAMLALARHAWPGNVRELRNAMDFVAASVAAGVVERASLPATITGVEASPAEAPRAPEPVEPAGAFRPIAEELEALERQRMREALHAAGGVKTRAARLISMPERTFRLKLRQYGLDPQSR